MKSVTTFDNFPTFAENGSRNMNTESAKYQIGFVEADTFPAEWANYLFHGATKGVSDLNTAVQSIWQENINVITQSGQTPNPNSTNQLYTAIQTFINNAVLTANQQVLAQAKLDAHPVGSLYWSSDPTDPSILFGGTWVRIKDRFVLAAGDTYINGATGGDATVQLTESQLPSHKHSFTPSGTISGGSYTFSGTSKNVNSGGAWSGYIRAFSGSTKPLSGMNEKNSGFYPEGTSGNMGRDFSSGSSNNTWWSFGKNGHTHAYTPEGSVSVSSDPSFTGTSTETESSGGQNSFSIMPPYEVAYCWRRTA